MLRGWRVVVIEDDYMVAKSLELSLSSMGMRVQWFSSATEALESPELLGADFYISDFSLPGSNGLDVLDRIQESSPQPINAVLMTGEMDRILRKWEPQPGQTFLRVASPTAHPTAQQ